MNEQFLQLLRSPVGNPLIFNEKDGVLTDVQTGEKYAVKERTPVLLHPSIANQRMTVTLSNGMQADIRYAAHYHEDAEAFDYFEAPSDGASSHEVRRLHQVIISRTPKSARTILDVGCGSAWVAAHFCQADSEMLVVSMDISVRNPMQAQQRYPFDNHATLSADVYALPFATASFDCIIASEVIEHTPDPKLFITSLLRVLKPSGRLIITTPYHENINFSLCVHCNRATPHHAHLHTFPTPKVEEMLSEITNISWKIDTFANKALIRLRTHVLLQYLPLALWKSIDAAVNWWYRRPLRMLWQIDKKNEALHY
jgi:ubiquinone/menaquinone biosynthesis C-methylase UbiE